MLYHPLMRIPCILVAMVGLTVTLTPPCQSPSPREKAVASSVGEETLLLSPRLPPILVKGLCWTFALAEIVAIIASQYPGTSLGKLALSSTFLFSNRTALSTPTTHLFFLGTSMVVLGACIRWQCYRELGVMFTFEMSIRADHRLVTSGPYRWVRHPGYSGLLLALPGVVIWHASPGSYARESGLLYTYFGRGCSASFVTIVLFVIYALLKRMSKEDEALERLFGDEWRQWARVVPYKLIPWIF